MKKWLTSLVLILALGSGALVGRPMSAGERGGMMSRMRCCHKAEMRESTPDVLTAKLCCLINCPQPGQTGTTPASPNGSTTFVNAQHPALLHALVDGLRAAPEQKLARASRTRSHPTYIRHLALLI